MSQVVPLVIVCAQLFLFAVRLTDAQANKSREDALRKTASQKITAHVQGECGPTTPFTVFCSNDQYNAASNNLFFTPVQLIACKSSAPGAGVYPADFLESQRTPASKPTGLEDAIANQLGFLCSTTLQPSVYTPFKDDDLRTYGKTFGTITALHRLLAHNPPPPPPPPPSKLLHKANPYVHLVSLLSPRFNAFLGRCKVAAFLCPSANKVYCFADASAMQSRFSVLQMEQVAYDVGYQLAANLSPDAAAADSFNLEIYDRGLELFRAICQNLESPGGSRPIFQTPADLMRTLQNQAAMMKPPASR